MYTNILVSIFDNTTYKFRLLFIYRKHKHIWELVSLKQRWDKKKSVLNYDGRFYIEWESCYNLRFKIIKT